MPEVVGVRRPVTERKQVLMTISKKDIIVYPESDGEPMADNTKQFRKIVTIEGNLERLFAQRQDVFVAGDLLWYPVEGNNQIRRAPDAMVAFGRPKGDRGSYMQWRENNIAPQVVFEVLSPGNRAQEMQDKLSFYDFYGVEEYYIYDPDRIIITGYLRTEAGLPLQLISDMRGWVSPRLGIRFEMERDDYGQEDLAIYYPDGKKFLTFLEIMEEQEQAELKAVIEQERAEVERYRREEAQQQSQTDRQERQQAENRARQSEQEREQAESRTKQIEQQLEAERQRVAKLEALLKQAGLLPEE